MAASADVVQLSRIINGNYAGTCDAGDSGACTGDIPEAVEVCVPCLSMLSAVCSVCGNLSDYVMEVFYD